MRVTGRVGSLGSRANIEIRYDRVLVGLSPVSTGLFLVSVVRSPVENTCPGRRTNKQGTRGLLLRLLRVFRHSSSLVEHEECPFLSRFCHSNTEKRKDLSSLVDDPSWKI